MSVTPTCGICDNKIKMHAYRFDHDRGIAAHRKCIDKMGGPLQKLKTATERRRDQDQAQQRAVKAVREALEKTGETRSFAQILDAPQGLRRLTTLFDTVGIQAALTPEQPASKL